MKQMLHSSAAKKVVKKQARVYYEAICAYFGTQPQAEQLAGFTLN